MFWCLVHLDPVQTCTTVTNTNTSCAWSYIVYYVSLYILYVYIYILYIYIYCIYIYVVYIYIFTIYNLYTITIYTHTGFLRPPDLRQWLWRPCIGNPTWQVASENVFPRTDGCKSRCVSGWATGEPHDSYGKSMKTSFFIGIIYKSS